MKNMPVLAIYGDYIAQDARWPTIRANGGKYFNALRAAGGSAEVIDLPEIGIKGNSHRIMMDKNRDAVAGIIHDWLTKRGLYK